MDYNNLTDAQLDQMIAQKMAKPQGAVDYNSLSDSELDNLIAQKTQQPTKTPSMVQGLMQKYGGSYLRPALQAGGAVGGALLAAPLAPFSMGAAPVAGGALGYAGGEQLYKVLEGLAGTREGGTLPSELSQAAKNVSTGALMELGGVAGTKALQAAAPYAVKGLSKISKSVYNVPGKATEIIAARPSAVKEASKLSPYEGGEKLISEINQAKFKKIMPAVEGLNRELSTATEIGKTVDLRPIYQKALAQELSLPKAMTKTAKNERRIVNEYLQGIGEQLNRELSPIEANELKRQLQAEAFTKDPVTGVAYKRKDALGDMMRTVAKETRLAIEQVVPGVKPHNKAIERVDRLVANKKFQRAFSPENIEVTMKNLQSETGNREYLQTLATRADQILGTNITPKTEEFFASKFMRPEEGISLFQTGRSGLGLLGGGILGGWPGAIAGTVATSPATFRQIAPRLGTVGTGAASQSLVKSIPYVLGREK